MSLRYEQYWSLRKTQEFLRELLVPGPQWPKSKLRERAGRCLRHFPPLTGAGQPVWSRDSFTKDDVAFLLKAEDVEQPDGKQ